ncbi:hypothetical protein SDC9_175421 [bioreactor metagenome]|uniref:Uncharacterized protein n=1 Tax=bioreactor metagenome TaxID=1076179 RepID=A0A645GM78_9ZZZZ
MGAGVGVAHDHRIARTDKAFFRENGVADAVPADVEKVLDVMTPRPVAQDFALFGGLGVLRRGHVVDDRLDFRGVEHAVFADGDQVVDRDRGRDLVTEHPVERQHPDAGGGRIDGVGVENLLSQCLSHIPVPSRFRFRILRLRFSIKYNSGP